MSGAAGASCLERGDGWEKAWLAPAAGSEKREIMGGSPWGKYIFHSSLTLTSVGVPQSPLATSPSVAPEAVGGVVDTEVQNLEVTLGGQNDQKGKLNISFLLLSVFLKKNKVGKYPL